LSTHNTTYKHKTTAFSGAVAQLTAQSDDMQTLLASLQAVGRLAQIELDEAPCTPDNNNNNNNNDDDDVSAMD
jgi:hypothetical protein